MNLRDLNLGLKIDMPKLQRTANLLTLIQLLLKHLKGSYQRTDNQ